MNDYFTWNGVKSTEYGIHVSELPPITLPLERSTQTTVPGRPGSLTSLEGTDVYDDLFLTATCFIDNSSRIPEIGRWLKGSGTVMFPNRIGGYYQARVANQIPFEQILRGNPYRSFSVAFRCFPFWYVDHVADISITSSGQTIINPGSVYAEPKMTIYGNGDITLMVGLTIIELENVSGNIVIDSVIQEAYQGTTLQNEKMTGEFPILQPGSTAISWTGSVSKIVISPGWRYL